MHALVQSMGGPETSGWLQQQRVPRTCGLSHAERDAPRPRRQQSSPQVPKAGSLARSPNHNSTSGPSLDKQTCTSLRYSEAYGWARPEARASRRQKRGGMSIPPRDPGYTGSRAAYLGRTEKGSCHTPRHIDETVLGLNQADGSSEHFGLAEVQPRKVQLPVQDAKGTLPFGLVHTLVVIIYRNESDAVISPDPIAAVLMSDSPVQGERVGETDTSIANRWQIKPTRTATDRGMSRVTGVPFSLAAVRFMISRAPLQRQQTHQSRGSYHVVPSEFDALPRTLHYQERMLLHVLPEEHHSLGDDLEYRDGIAHVLLIPRCFISKHIHCVWVVPASWNLCS